MSNNEWSADQTVRVPPAAPPSQPPPPPPPPSQPPPPAAYVQPPAYGQAPPYGQPPAYGAQPFGAPATGKYRAPGGSITMIVGALLAMLGTFLPWVTFDGGFSDSVNGYETYFIGDDFDAVQWTNPGAYVLGTMVIVVIMAVVILAAGRSTATCILGIIAAGLAGLMTLGALSAVGSVLNQDVFDRLTIGVGIALCLIGAITAGVGAIIVAAKKS